MKYSSKARVHSRASCAKVKRIKALLSTNCMTLEEVGTRVGVTRERVRQVGELVGIRPADERHAICKLEHLKPYASSLTKLAMVELDKRGIPYLEYGRFLNVNGKNCVVISMSRHPVGGNKVSPERRSKYVQLRRSASHADFTLGKVSKGGPWFVVPWDTFPEGRSTTFSLDPKPGMGARTARHDYLSYKERWDLLQ